MTYALLALAVGLRLFFVGWDKGYTAAQEAQGVESLTPGR